MNKHPSLKPLDVLFVSLNSVFALIYILALIRGNTDGVSFLMLSIFLLTIPAGLLLVCLGENSSSGILCWMRTFYPQGMFALYFTQSIRLSRLLHEGTWDGPINRLEELVFGGRPVMDFFYAVPRHPVVNEIIFFAYFSFYFFLTLPWWILYFKGKRLEAEQCLFTIIASFSLLYLWYIVFPVAGPKFFYPELNALWYGHFEGGIFTFIMKSMFTPSTMAGAAFPSSHVAIGLLSLLLNLRHNPPLGRWMVALYLLLVFSTIYLYTHYVVDLIAGILYGAAAFLLVPPVTTALYRTAVLSGDPR